MCVIPKHISQMTPSVNDMITIVSIIDVCNQCAGLLLENLKIIACFNNKTDTFL